MMWTKRVMRSVACAGLLAVAPFGQAAAETFSVLTYNVRGLPALVIEDRTAEIAAIAPLLEDFHTPGGDHEGIDAIVHLQELFDQGYYDTLTDDQTVSYPSITVKDTSGPNGLGDGLNRLSDFTFTGYNRETWNMCFGTQGENGSDCDTNKGYSVARHELEPGIFVDVYNLHADAGQDEGSRAARRDQIEQLIAGINTQSPEGTAVIVMGDTNSHYTRTPNDNIETLLSGTGVTDVWVELVNGGVVPGAGPDNESECDTAPSGPNCELIDKVFYRSGDDVTLMPTSYVVLNELFSDGGGDLSDHFPVSVLFDYQVVGATTTTLGGTTTTTIDGGTTTTLGGTTTTLGGTTTTTLGGTTTTLGGTTTTFDGTTTTSTTTTTSSTVTSSTSTTTSSTLPPAGSCGDPVALTAGNATRDAVITASDALFTLRAAVGTETCDACLCDIDGNGTVTASDALSTLKAAVGQPVTLNCPACV